MAQPKAPSPEVFDPRTYGRTRSCILCDSHTDIVTWVTASLSGTHKAGFPRPSVLHLCRRINEVFKVHYSRSLIERHLREHEPNWNLWDAPGTA